MRRPILSLVLPGLLVLASGAMAHGTSVEDAKAVQQGVVEAKKAFDAAGLAGLAKQAKGAVDSVTVKPNGAEAISAISQYIVGVLICKEAPPSPNASVPAAYFTGDTVGTVLDGIAKANGMKQERVGKIFGLVSFGYTSVFGGFKAGSLAPKLEFVGTVQRAIGQAKKAVMDNGIMGLRDLCMVKGEAAKASRDETAAVEFISLMVYGFKLDSGATQMNKMIKPNPYFADPMTSITAMLQPFGAANANALITFVNGEVDDAATAQAVD